MKGNLLTLTKIVVAAAILVSTALFLPGEDVQASNMGFKMNKSIAPRGVPAPKGQNFVSLPFNNPYADSQAVCDALNLTAGNGTVSQINASTGVTLLDTCGGGGAFPLLPFVGVRVENNVAASGILVGSHKPGQSVTLFALGLPAPKGQNAHPVLYHTTAATSEELCVDLGLPAGNAVVQRVDAGPGITLADTCGGGGAYPLVLGEAVVITFTGANITTPAGKPSHF